MRTTTRLALHSVVVLTAAVVASASALVSPAQASQSAPTAAAVSFNSDAYEVEHLDSGDLRITQPGAEFDVVITQQEIQQVTAEATRQAAANSDVTISQSIVTCGGTTWQGPYFCLSRLGQQMLIAGSIAAVVAALCAINLAVCVIASAAAAMLAVWLNEVGPCPRDVRVDYYWSGALRGIRCL